MYSLKTYQDTSISVKTTKFWPARINKQFHGSYVFILKNCADKKKYDALENHINAIKEKFSKRQEKLLQYKESFSGEQIVNIKSNDAYLKKALEELVEAFKKKNPDSSLLTHLRSIYQTFKKNIESHEKLLNKPKVARVRVSISSANGAPAQAKKKSKKRPRPEAIATEKGGGAATAGGAATPSGKVSSPAERIRVARKRARGRSIQELQAACRVLQSEVQRDSNYFGELTVFLAEFEQNVRIAKKYSDALIANRDSCPPYPESAQAALTKPLPTRYFAVSSPFPECAFNDREGLIAFEKSLKSEKMKYPKKIKDILSKIGELKSSIDVFVNIKERLPVRTDLPPLPTPASAIPALSPATPVAAAVIAREGGSASASAASAAGAEVS